MATPARLGGWGGGAAASSSVSNTFSIGAGNNRCLIVNVYVDSNIIYTGTPTVTYGGQSCSYIGGVADGINFCGFYYLNDAGIEAASSTTVQVTGGANKTSFNTQAYENVSQTAPTSIDTGTGSANPLTGISLSASAGDLCIGGSCIDVHTATSVSWGGTNGLTVIRTRLNLGGDYGTSFADRVSSAAETVNHSCTWNGTSYNYNASVMILIPGATTNYNSWNTVDQPNIGSWNGIDDANLDKLNGINLN